MRIDPEWIFNVCHLAYAEYEETRSMRLYGKYLAYLNIIVNTGYHTQYLAYVAKIKKGL